MRFLRTILRLLFDATLFLLFLGALALLFMRFAAASIALPVSFLYLFKMRVVALAILRFALVAALEILFFAAPAGVDPNAFVMVLKLF